MQWEEDRRPVPLRHKVDLIGAKPPYNFINLTLNPAGMLKDTSSCEPAVWTRVDWKSFKNSMIMHVHKILSDHFFSYVYIGTTDVGDPSGIDSTPLSKLNVCVAYASYQL